MTRDQNVSTSPPKKRRSKKYFRAAKRKQRARLREDFGPDGYREILRDEKRFSGLEELIAQIKRDIAEARRQVAGRAPSPEAAPAWY